MQTLLLGGVGDCFTGTSFIDFYNVTDVYWATKVHVQVRPLFDKVFPHLNHYIVDQAFSDTRKGFIQAAQLPVKNYPSDVVEWSPHTLCQTDHSTFHQSPLVTHQLADIGRFQLPDEYIAIQPYTLTMGSNRDFTRQDWDNALVALGDRPGVIVDASWLDIPEDPRLINLQRQTSLAEALEVVKQASGFLGIDSCHSVIACQMGYPLQVRSCNTWYYACQKVYGWPHTDGRYANWGIRADRLMV